MYRDESTSLLLVGMSEAAVAVNFFAFGYGLNMIQS